MRAEAGDELLVRARHVGDQDRHGAIIEVHGHDGAAPYLVKWTDGHQSVFMPSSGTLIEHRPGGQQES